MHGTGSKQDYLLSLPGLFPVPVLKIPCFHGENPTVQGKPQGLVTLGTHSTSQWEKQQGRTEKGKETEWEGSACLQSTCQEP